MRWDPTYEWDDYINGLEKAEEERFNYLHCAKCKGFLTKCPTRVEKPYVVPERDTKGFDGRFYHHPSIVVQGVREVKICRRCGHENVYEFPD